MTEEEKDLIQKWITKSADDMAKYREYSMCNVLGHPIKDGSKCFCGLEWEPWNQQLNYHPRRPLNIGLSLIDRLYNE
jgi:hypothetical protein